MNRVFTLAPGENWIVDRFVREWNSDNQDIVTLNPTDADVIWLFADWCSNQLPSPLLASKKVVTTIHHIVPEKFGPTQVQEFMIRDAVTDVYHVPNKYTYQVVDSLTKKPIHILAYWANQKIWRKTGTKTDLRQKYGIPLDAYVVGSCQRDTEGASINQGTFLPKLEKGPDLLADFIITTARSRKVHVVLAGWRRQYLIQRLKQANVSYTYVEMPSQEIVNDLYQTLDLYPVTARYEGGPQSLIECGLLGIPVVSRPVGIAYQVLSKEAINEDVALATPTIPNVESLCLPWGYEPYRKLFESL